ncbi:MAG: T9SS type A sorting domain-containing protein, partial [bacterium]
YTSSTVGIQDQSRTIAIQCLYNGNYANGAAPIASGRAIKYVTAGPTGVVFASQRLLFRVVTVFPNPARSFAEIVLTAIPDPITLNLYDRLGRRVMDISPPRGVNRVRLDCRRLKPGVYFLKVNGKTTSLAKLLVVH